MDPKAYEAKMISTLKERTGKSLEEWLAEVQPALPAEKKGRVKWLKETYGMGQNTAMLILGHLEGGTLRDENHDLVDAQFTKDNAPLRPLYDDLAARIQALGTDVALRACKGYVPFYHKKQFVFLMPKKGKLHVGLALPEGTENPRLVSSEGLGGPERIKLQAVVTSPAEIDEELMGLIRQAYELN